MKMSIRVAMLEDALLVAELAIQMWKSHTIEELTQEFYEYISKENGTIFLCYDRWMCGWICTMWIKT